MNKQTENTENKICPFLGLSEDQESHMAFTSPLNACHGSKSSPTQVKLDHQNSHCLTADFADCQVFLAGEEKAFPRALRNRMRVSQDYGSHSSDRRPFFLVIALILLGAAYWWFGMGRGALSPLPLSTPFATQTASPTAIEVSTLVLGIPSPKGPETATLDPRITATVTPFPTLTLTVIPTLTATNTPTQTLTSVPTSTFTITPTATAISAHSLEIPIGPVQKYLIHRVIGGESLNALASQNQSSIEAILAVNYSLTSPIMEGSLIIIPIGIDNPAILPVFEIYQVTHQEISAEDLATILATDSVLFKYFNDSQDGELLFQGDWMLVPRERE